MKNRIPSKRRMKRKFFSDSSKQKESQKNEWNEMKRNENEKFSFFFCAMMMMWRAIRKSSSPSTVFVFLLYINFCLYRVHLDFFGALCFFFCIDIVLLKKLCFFFFFKFRQSTFGPANFFWFPLKRWKVVEYASLATSQFSRSISILSKNTL